MFKPPFHYADSSYSTENPSILRKTSSTMAAQWLFCNALIALLIFFIAPHLSKSDDRSTPSPGFAYSWMDDDDEFYPGDIATIEVKILGNYNSEEYKYPFDPNITVNGSMGNSSYVTDVHSDFGNDTNNWRILFKPIMVGVFYMVIDDEHFRVHDNSLHFHVSPAKSYIPPHFMFRWLNSKSEFKAGDNATIQVIVSENLNTKTYKYPFNPNITVSDYNGKNEKMGNSSYITGVSYTLGPDTNKWELHFMPIMVGMFHVLITQENLNVFDASMSFSVTPAFIYKPAGTVSWRGEGNHFVAGTTAKIMVLPKDAFGNNATRKSEGSNVIFDIYATTEEGEDATVLDVSQNGWNTFGGLSTNFIAATSGNLLLHVKDKNQHLIGSPLTFMVDPGPLDVGNCVPHWGIESKSFQIFSIMETFITQRDKYGNLIPGFYPFDFDVIEKGTNLSLPIGDLKYQEVVPGVQSLSFKLLQHGEFSLIITDKDKKKQILNMPYEFSIYIGYCDGMKSIVNGSGLHNSVAGEVSKFSIFLRDAYQYPSPIEVHRLRVEITLPSLSLHVDPQIYPMDPDNDVTGTQSTGMFNFGALEVPSIYLHNNKSDEDWKTWNSNFEVVYIPEKSGVYEIRIYCGNIPLNEGKPFTKFVSAGKVNASVSRVVKYKARVSKAVLHSVDLQLMDSFSNPVLLQESELSKLTLEPDSINKPFFMVVLFVDNRDGTYTGFYMPMNLGTYKICASFDGMSISPCPFEVTTYNREDFPIAYGLDVSVWEDESIVFNALVNDYFVGGKAKVVEYERPGHGSLLQYGDLFIYTPFKRFYGNDSFPYSMSDANGNNASSHVNISVRCIPPQFVSFPTQLQADEDTFSPKFGGYSGFEITYSDSTENISIMFTAQHGSVFLSPLQMQLWDPMWKEISVTKREGTSKELIIRGRLEVINFAIKSLKYIGEGNFSGEDTVKVTTMNKHGKYDWDIPVIVNPRNDPPFINVPEFILLENVTKDEGFLIFDRQRDNFNFSIGDPDHLHFTGNKSHFRVMFSVEVSSGYFSANLPAELTSTTELKLKNSNSNQWQPLLTFIEISRRFSLKAKAIRFRGTIEDCNTLLQQILYYGDEDGGVLTVSVNDMGWYGCYPEDCQEMMSVPLISEASINLIRKMPVDPVVAHSLISAIVIESTILSSLTTILIFYTSKCVFALLHKKFKDQPQPQSQNFQLHKLQSSHEHMSSTKDSSENITGQPSSLSNPLNEESKIGLSVDSHTSFPSGQINGTLSVNSSSLVKILH
ncbi:protein GAMETE EXPRESSED 2 isoform X1 [Lactuca sativa]|uniref:protein GAMETE EXPRESSED 2 isoform X1 n=1 Tax=Lactuca sativa TaxID=4236 RepID=UPI000CD8D61E|nr:protein GAMETE EXPRESSED 2 isoform X1 [Lactuca sativa]XP_052620732.1 protein GAMETE EXPRESSED 2 isoform X1 [Lactuca sativa]